MGDTRAVGDPAEEVGQLSAKLKDLEATLLARLARRPTGDVEPTLRTTAKPNTLILNGAAVSRTTYAALWAWVQEQGLVTAGVFGNGDGSTTFTLPDLRGRVLRGLPASGETIGQKTGADSITLTQAQLPSHSHTISSVGNHQHQRSGGNFYTNTAGQHNGHNYSGTIPTGSGLPYGTEPDGLHNHTVAPGDQAGGHSHTAGNTGSGDDIDNRQASYNVNWLIWT